MFEWLDKEIYLVRDTVLHSLDGPASPALREAICDNSERFPEDYVNFILKYGNARLFKWQDCYLLQVFATPDLLECPEGLLFRFGTDDDEDVYFFDDGVGVKMSEAVYTHSDEGLREVAPSFVNWLKQGYQSTLNQFSEEELTRLRRDAKFSPEDLAVISARRKFRWRVEGRTAEGKIQIRIMNDSERMLPFYTIGVKSKDSDFTGAVWVPVDGIRPGDDRLLAVDCYSELLSPTEVTLFDMPEPTPPERDSYWEFQECDNPN